MVTALKINRLSFAYPGAIPVFNEISCDLSAGEKVGIIGPNGAGKTTLFMLIAGIFEPTDGALSIFNKPVEKGVFNPAVGMIFQHTADQLISPSVKEDIAFGPQNMGKPSDEIDRRVREAAIKTDIEALLDRPPHQLSGGEQRLVALAGILAMEPLLLLMDEPTSDLDLRYRRRLINLMAGMQDKTVLIASHDLEFIIETCNRVLLLEGGKLQADGKPVNIMGNKKLMEKHGLEVPHSLTAAWHYHKK